MPPLRTQTQLTPARVAVLDVPDIVFHQDRAYGRSRTFGAPSSRMLVSVQRVSISAEDVTAESNVVAAQYLSQD